MRRARLYALGLIVAGTACGTALGVPDSAEVFPSDASTDAAIVLGDGANDPRDAHRDQDPDAPLDAFVPSDVGSDAGPVDAASDSSVFADGSTGDGDAAPSPARWASLVGGRSTPCAVDLQGRLFCWGGIAGSGIVSSPKHIPLPWPVGKIAAGDAVCVTDPSSVEVRCFGDNRNGQVGTGSRNSVLVPTVLPGFPRSGETINLIASGQTSVCATTSPSNELYCWGSDQRGELGLGTPPPRLNSMRWSPTLVPGFPAAGEAIDRLWVARGALGTVCARTAPSGTTYCWGANDYHRQGLPIGDAVSSPSILQPFPPAGQVIELLSTGQAMCATANGSSQLFCWGSNHSGQFGVGSPIQSPIAHAIPAFPPPGETILQIESGAWHVCTLLEPSAQVRCWGDNQYGQLGRGASGVASPVPSPVVGLPPGDPVQAIAPAGVYSACAFTASHRIFCWGRNDYGQLGVGDLVDRSLPTEVR